MLSNSPISRWAVFSTGLAAALLGAGRSLAQEPSSHEPPRAVEVLETVWPEHPEWVAMFVDILQGSELGPDDGWFRKAKAHSRYDWRGASGRFDTDHDGRIERSEFAGPDTDFAHLDRDGDGALTEPDFDFSPHALTPTPGLMLFYRLDADGNGGVSKEEVEAFFDRTDSGQVGFLSQQDLQEALSPPRRGSGGSSDGPSRWTLVKGLFRQEIGSMQPGPRVGEKAPDFTLKTQDGSRQVTLSDLIGPKPVVLVFGNFTCGPFRGQAGDVRKLYERYRDRATFVMVYVREAHPTDGWNMSSNARYGVQLRQPRSYAERLEVAKTCSQALNLGFPMLVDEIDDRVGALYSGMPSRLYVIDRDGVIASKSGR
ncbi:MAG TPA: deiodinase family protein, partial [Isosphaeraceae bacterium]|nr:deiodinase family protein [Isosphaeraceae bacterium]